MLRTRKIFLRRWGGKFFSKNSDGCRFGVFLQPSHYFKHINTLILKFRKLSNLLNTSTYLRVITRSKAVSPTHFLLTRYPHPKSLPSGKGLAFALAGSKSGVSHLRNLSQVFLFHGLVSECKDSGLYRLFPNNLPYIISLLHLLAH